MGRAALDPGRVDWEFDGASGIERGELHWNHELFRVISVVLAARSREEARLRSAEWLEALGGVGPAPGQVLPPEDVYLQAGTSWFRDAPYVDSRLSGLLTQIHESRPTKPRQRYVSHARSIRNPTCSGELDQADLKAPDPGYRLEAMALVDQTQRLSLECVVGAAAPSPG